LYIYKEDYSNNPINPNTINNNNPDSIEDFEDIIDPNPNLFVTLNNKEYYIGLNHFNNIICT
jgi:hypothetical protein